MLGIRSLLSGCASDHKTQSLGRGRRRRLTVEPLEPRVLLAADVIGRFIFYNNSSYDGNDPTATDLDDSAIATDKTPLLPGSAASFANYTSYQRGINGVMLDIADVANAGSLNATDFAFAVGNDNNPTAWTTAPPPSSVWVRQGEGVNASDRVTIIWPDNVIENEWLEVTVQATSNTGLVAPDIHYWGNAIGETGNDAGNAFVNAFDTGFVRDNPHGFLSPAEIDDPADFNRDRRVDAFDFGVARDSATGFLDAVGLVSPMVDTACSNSTVMIDIDDPTAGASRRADFGIFRTLAPRIRINAQSQIDPNFAVIVDDGDDLTADELTITNLFTVAGASATAEVPEMVPIGTLPGPNQDLFRSLPDDSSAVRIFYFGENRIRFSDPGLGTCHAFLLNYDAFDETVVGPNDGVEPIPGEPENEMMTNHIILNFDPATTDAAISDFLFNETVRPQGISRDLGAVQVRETDHLGGSALLARIAELDAAIGVDADDAHLDQVTEDPTIAGETYPKAFDSDLQVGGAFSVAGRRNHHQHFVMQTFPAHRLIDLTRDQAATVRVLMPGSGVGNGNNFSGAAANDPNAYFVRGNRMFQATQVTERNIFPFFGVRVATAIPSDAGNPNVGDIRNVADVAAGNGHDTAVMATLAGDGVGNQIANADRSVTHIQLGTGKDAQIRIVRFPLSTMAYYRQLEISANDANTRIHLIERSYSSNRTPAAPVRRNLNMRYRAISDAGKLIVAAAWNEGAAGGDVANADSGRIAHNHNTSRADLAGANAFRKNVMVIGESDRLLTPNVLERRRPTSNPGEEISVVAPGQFLSVGRIGNLVTVGGTSFATPLVAGIAAELMLVDPTLQRAANIIKVAELIEATADDIAAAGRDNNSGHGRVNFWKAVLSAANGGLSSEGRMAIGGANNNDNFFKSLALKNEADTTWYGFEVRSDVQNSVLWFRKQDGSYAKVQDVDQSRPDVTGVDDADVVNYLSTQTHRRNPGNRILPSLPFSGTELTATNVEQWFLSRFSIKKDQLTDKTHLLAVKKGKTPDTTGEGGDVVLSVPLDIGEMRKASGSANDAIKQRVREFDDFVFHISCPTTGAVRIDGCTSDWGDADPKYPTSEVTMVLDIRTRTTNGSDVR